jgi:hypothetical protein
MLSRKNFFFGKYFVFVSINSRTHRLISHVVNDQICMINFDSKISIFRLSLALKTISNDLFKQPLISNIFYEKSRKKNYR